MVFTSKQFGRLSANRGLSIDGEWTVRGYFNNIFHFHTVYFPYHVSTTSFHIFQQSINHSPSTPLTWSSHPSCLVHRAKSQRPLRLCGRVPARERALSRLSSGRTSQEVSIGFAGENQLEHPLEISYLYVENGLEMIRVYVESELITACFEVVVECSELGGGFGSHCVMCHNTRSFGSHVCKQPRQVMAAGFIRNGPGYFNLNMKYSNKWSIKTYRFSLLGARFLLWKAQWYH